MKGIHYIIAVIVIVCLIFWRKSIVNKRGKGQKSIDSSSKAKNNSKKEDLHKISETKSSEKTSASKLTEVKEKEAYDGSRKKDRGKKRRQKKNTNSAIDEIKKKTEEVKEKSEAKAEEVKAETKAKLDEVKKEAKEIKEKAEVKAEKVTEEVKEKAQDVKKEAEVKTEEVKEEVSKESKKVQAKAKEVKVETQAKAEEVKKEAKEIKEKAEVKAEKVKEEVKEKAQDVKKEAEVKAEEVKKEVKEKTEAVKEKVKEEVKEEKSEIENKIASTGNYPDLITSLKNNPWTSDDLNTRVKFEDIRRQVTLHEEEITDLPLDKIKTSLSPESLVDFLNMTSAKPTILNRKEYTSYEFTTRDPKEIDLIKKRYGLLDREIDKITSVLIFDKEGQKLKEVKDVLAEGKNRIYMETKF